jgi:trk system potassium uptake protein TrkH
MPGGASSTSSFHQDLTKFLGASRRPRGNNAHDSPHAYSAKDMPSEARYIHGTDAGRHAARAFRLVAAQLLGVLVLSFCVMLLPPIAVTVIYDDGLLGLFLTHLAVALPIGALLLAYSARRAVRLRIRDGFVAVAMLWFALSVFASLPLYFGAGLSYPDAIFEAASGITTTGATVITGLDTLPRSLLFFRQEIQWFGGIGVIVSAIAVLPMMRLGGMQMMKAETPGPVKGTKLTPRIMETARALWGIYLVLTLACAVFYWFAGMETYDAIAHSLTTVSTGGFSTHDASIGFYGSPSIEAIAVVFMILGAINFNVHFAAWAQFDLRAYFRNEEVRSFLAFTALVVLAASAALASTGIYDTVAGAARAALFTVVSVITSTGYGVADFSVWPLMLPVLLIFISFVGGCAGSTAGGMKVMRFVIMTRQAQIEVQRLIHPALVKPLRVDGRTVTDEVIRGVWAFFMVYVVVFAALMMILMGQGHDQVTAFGAVATCLNNLGPGLGDVATNFVALGDPEKLVLVFAMIAGRLEIFTIFVLLTPAFWRG